MQKPHAHAAQVQPPPGPDGQQAQLRYAPILAPMLPMVMPYGMMPYAPPMQLQHAHMQPQPLHFPPQAAPVPPVQANNPGNNIFAGAVQGPFMSCCPPSCRPFSCHPVPSTSSPCLHAKAG